MGLADKLAGAKINRTGEYLVPGDYVLEIVELKMQKSAKRRGQENFIAKMKVVSYDGPNASTEKPGKERGWVKNPDGEYNEAGEILKFLGVCSGIDPNDAEKIEQEVNGEVQELAVSDEQPFKGVQIVCTVLPPKPGKSYCKTLFYPMEAAE